MINGLRNFKHISKNALDRIELYSKLIAVEAKIERGLFLRKVAWASFGAIFSIFAIGMIHVVVIGSFWYTDYRVLGMLGVLLLDLIAAGAGFYFASKPNLAEPFATTKHQLAEDMKFIKESL